VNKEDRNFLSCDNININIYIFTIVTIIGARLLNKYGTFGNALKEIYPEYSWDLDKFSYKGKKSTQRWLYFKLKELLPNVDIIEDYNHPNLVWGMKQIKLISFMGEPSNILMNTTLTIIAIKESESDLK
jgi:hypothetical protein